MEVVLRQVEDVSVYYHSISRAVELHCQQGIQDWKMQTIGQAMSNGEIESLKSNV